jgi:hypothetical protein
MLPWWLWIPGVVVAAAAVASRCTSLSVCVPEPCCPTAVRRVCGAGWCGAFALCCCRGVRCGFYASFVFLLLFVMGAIIRLREREDAVEL